MRLGGIVAGLSAVIAGACTHLIRSEHRGLIGAGLALAIEFA